MWCNIWLRGPTVTSVSIIYNHQIQYCPTLTTILTDLTDDNGNTPLDLATENSTKASFSESEREIFTEIADYLKLLPTNHSEYTPLFILFCPNRLDLCTLHIGAVQRRTSSENHERMPPPAKRPRTQNGSLKLCKSEAPSHQHTG